MYINYITRSTNQSVNAVLGFNDELIFVSKVGLEPARSCSHWILNLNTILLISFIKKEYYCKQLKNHFILLTWEELTRDVIKYLSNNALKDYFPSIDKILSFCLCIIQ